MGDIGAPELIIIGIILVLLFGATRLPATAKGLGQALRLFKKEIRDDDDAAKPAAVAPAGPTAGHADASAAPATRAVAADQAVPTAHGATAAEPAPPAHAGRSDAAVETHGTAARPV